jgi:hypothetical protein
MHSPCEEQKDAEKSRNNCKEIGFAPAAPETVRPRTGVGK